MLSHSYLMGVTREEATCPRKMNASSHVFIYVDPRIFFSEGEQALLLEAMVGKSDSEIAITLDITVNTVYKRWKSIFARVVSSRIPGLTPPEKGDGTRRKEIRTKLVNYLWGHLEELRPYPRPDRETRRRLATRSAEW